MSEKLLTVKEAAGYLSINEKKLYALANAHQIPCTRVTGKWLFPKKLLDEWITTSAKGNLGSRLDARSLQKNIIFHGSHDLLLEILACKLKKQFSDYSLSISHVGSLGGLVSLSSGICHLTGIHLTVANQDTGNIKELLQGLEVVFVRLTRRRQGLMVAAGNPRGIKSIADLVKPKISYINRQPGSGTRMLFDQELKQLNISSGRIKGYDWEVFTHMEVAMEIFNEHADAGLGVYSAAHTFKLDFIPVAEENYDLVIPKEIFFHAEIQALLKTIRSGDFKQKADALGGYNMDESGEIVAAAN